MTLVLNYAHQIVLSMTTHTTKAQVKLPNSSKKFLWSKKYLEHLVYFTHFDLNKYLYFITLASPVKFKLPEGTIHVCIPSTAHD